MSNRDLQQWQERCAKEAKTFVKSYSRKNPDRTNHIQNKLRKYAFDHHETAQENIYGYCRAKIQKGSGESLTSKDGVVHDHVMLPVLFESSNSKNGSKTGSKNGSKSGSSMSARNLKKWEQEFNASNKNPTGAMDLKQLQALAAARSASKSASVASSRAGRSRLSKASKPPQSVLSHSKVIQEVIHSQVGSQVGNSVHPKDSASQMVVASSVGGGSASSSIAMAVEELVKREVKQHIDQYLRTMAKKRLDTIKE